MRVAVISDIHGNLHALEASLAAIRRERPDEIWCLGDLVGYGARPNECCLTVEEQAGVCLAGNHDLGVRGDVDLDSFSPDAAAAARWTRQVLGGGARAFLARLSPLGEASGVQLFHGSPRDPVWEYVLTEEAARAALEETTASIVLVGHSHVPLALQLDDGRLEGGHAPGGTTLDLRQGRWLLNPGSIGQPRDGDPRAAHLLLDLDGRRAAFVRSEYPVERTQAEIRAAGLPELLAERLAGGL
ncbi:MAG TPA: metallophosphoesterase family protein [Gaiellaceae bacterium]|nr:metallophosphoesterase family protein [Gaiellaceae bacterium]